MKLMFPKSKIRILAFMLYNFLYITYMIGYTSQDLYFFSLIVFNIMNLFVLIKKKGKLNICLNEFRLGISYIIFFLFISLFIQFIHMDFQIYLFTGLIKLFLPILNAFFIVNTFNEQEQQLLFNILLMRFTIHFFWQNYQYFNLQGLMTISWFKSTSIMETSMAHDFMIMELYYLSEGKRKKSLFCVLLCMLSMKRLSFILAPLIYLFSFKIPKNTMVKKNMINFIKVMAIISPFVIMILYTRSSQEIFYKYFNIDLNLAMGGRITIYNIMKNNIPYFNGYGSINSFLSSYVYKIYGTIWNATLHNDFLRVYYETTIFGVIILANNLVDLCKDNYWHFLMITYLIFVAITSHIFNYFSVWVTFYMVIMNSKYKKRRIYEYKG